MSLRETIEKGLENPREIPPYVIGRFFPESRLADTRWGPNWQKKGGVITWREGFEWGNESPPDISANDYYTYTALKNALEDRDVETALDLGCGYGRVTPWIGEFVGEVEGIDPNPEPIETARSHYPEFRFRVASGQNLPHESDSFDLVVTWTVLQHIPPDDVSKVADEIQRVLGPEGWFLALEDTDTSFASPDGWPRSVEEYSELFSHCSLLEVDERSLPWTDKKSGLRVLLFEIDE